MASRQFYGVPYKKAARRQNRPGGSPRKLYPFVRKDQRGTPMERFVNSNYDSLIEQGNQINLRDGQMYQSQAWDNLKKVWGGTNRKMTSASAIADYIRKNGGTAKNARTAQMGSSTVSFGADPYSR